MADTWRIPTPRFFLAAIALLAVFFPSLGCTPPPAATTADAEPSLPSDEEVRQRPDEVLDWTCENRHLNLRDHAAWQVLHGVLAYQRSFLVETEPGGKRIPAVDYLLGGGEMKGWSLEPGRVVDEKAGRRGLRAVLEQGSKVGQEHTDQWLANLSLCQLPLTQKIILNGHAYTVADFVELPATRR